MHLRTLARTGLLAVAGALILTPASTLVAQSSSFSDQDKSFLKDFAGGNLAEVKLAELVVRTSKDPEILAFARKMIHDHTLLYDSEKPVAAQAAIKLPTSPDAMQTTEYLTLKVLSGETFDKNYVKTMVNDHAKDLQEGKQEHDSTQNPEMKKLTAHAASIISEHKQMIDSIAGKMGIL